MHAPELSPFRWWTAQAQPGAPGRIAHTAQAGRCRAEDLHTVSIRSASLLHTRELRCWVTGAKGGGRHETTHRSTGKPGRASGAGRRHACGDARLGDTAAALPPTVQPQ